MDIDRRGVKRDTVVLDLDGSDLGEDGADPTLGGIAEGEQVDVARGAVRVTGPDREECGPLQHELACVTRGGQPVEEPLVSVAEQDELEVVAALAGEAQEAGAGPGADVRSLVPHASASR